MSEQDTTTQSSASPVIIDDYAELSEAEFYNTSGNGNGNGHRHITKLDLTERDPDDSGNAQTMHDMFKDRLLYCPAFGWMKWVGTHWKQTSDAAVVKMAVYMLRQRRHAAVDANKESLIKATKPSQSNVLACVRIFRALVTVEDAADFDADPELLNCANGILNTKTGSLTPHLPCQRFTYCAPVDYDSQADMSVWKSFIHEVVDNDEVVHFLQRAIGYALTGYTRDEKMFYLFGPPRAGKGTFTETMLSILPKPIGVEVDFNSFTARREADSQNFDLAPLKPARLVVASESNRFQSLNPAKIKAITGGNWIRAAFKHKDMFEYRPQFKVFLVSNHEVNADPDDDALWGRVLVIVFPHSHLGDEDTQLKERMKSPDILKGVLRWAVEGSMMWYETGLQVPEKIVKDTKQQRDGQDYIMQWFTQSCHRDIDAWEPSSKLMVSYKDWCESNGCKPASSRDFSSALIKRFKLVPGRKGHAGPRSLKGAVLHSSDYNSSDNNSSYESGDSGDSGDSKNGEVSIENSMRGKRENLLSPVSPVTTFENERSDIHPVIFSIPICYECKATDRVVLQKDVWTCLAHGPVMREGEILESEN